MQELYECTEIPNGNHGCKELSYNSRTAVIQFPHRKHYLDHVQITQTRDWTYASAPKDLRTARSSNGGSDLPDVVRKSLFFALHTTLSGNIRTVRAININNKTVFIFSDKAVCDTKTGCGINMNTETVLTKIPYKNRLPVRMGY